jgi:predicted CXXCH cytochrome family protein
MNKKGLLHKTKLYILIILVLCIQIVGSNQISNTSVVKAEGTGTDPLLTVLTPESNQFFKTGSMTISGTIVNFTTGLSIKIIDNNAEIKNFEVTGDTWSTSVELQEGPHQIKVQLEDSQGNIFDTKTISNLTIDTVSPTIGFVNLSSGTIANSIELATESSATVQICFDCNGSLTGTGTWVDVTKNSKGKWIYSDPQMRNGSYTVFAKATDRAGNVSTTEQVTFTLDTLRPVILLDSIVPAQDMTNVPPKNTEIKFMVSDAHGLNVSKNSITVTSNGEPVPGETRYNPDTKEISFVIDPDVTSLSYSTKYYVYISPLGITDEADNKAFPRFWSFTTESAAPSKDPYYEISYNSGDKLIQRESPHQAYANNVNVCINCHSTHEASNPNLLDQKKNTDDDRTQLTVDNYCMACHDGTVAPMPENSQATHKHTAAIDTFGKPSGSSCASCHNPHLSWSEHNPNLAQDHIKYKHLPSDPGDPNKPTEEISSKEQLCESCHENDNAEKIANPAVNYGIFQYNKSFTAIGIYEDYELCLRCHKTKVNKIVQPEADTNETETNEGVNLIPDIAKFYSQLTKQTKEEFETTFGVPYSSRDLSSDQNSISGHIIKAKDGSPLAGYMPCAECHDTHGSKNIKQLKEKLGHEQLGTENKQAFTAIEGEWDVTKERSFCFACHNNETALYGIKVELDKTIVGHRDIAEDKQKSCASCHTDNFDPNKENFDLKEFMREAAHAPKRKPILPTSTPPN